MSIYRKYGVEPIIDCAGSSRFGGILLSPEIKNAMNEAAEEVVRLDELQAAASKVIATHTGAEAGIITSGASAGFTLAIAACLAGLDVARMNRLPDTTHMPDEILMAAGHVGSYDHAVRLTGAKIIAVDTPNQLYSPSYNYMPEPWEYEAAITDRTAAIAYISYRGDHTRPSLNGVAEVARRHGIPLVVDAATAIPPRANLRDMIEIGADLITISGGKGMRGPKASGLLFGRYELVASAALQSMEMGSLSFDDWDLPEALAPKSKLRGLPQQGIGRGMMATKEAVIGMLAALEGYTLDRMSAFNKEERRLLEIVAEKIKDVPGLTMEWIQYNPEARAQLKLYLDEDVLATNVREVTRKLRSGSPRIYVRGDPVNYITPDLPSNVIIVNGFNLTDDHATIVAERMKEALSAR